MKVLKCKIGLVWLVVLLLGQVALAKEFYQEVKKQMPITKHGQVQLSNTRGIIEVKTWNKNEVSVVVFITVNARNQTDANEVFDRIKIKFDAHENTVSALTEIESLPRWSWNYVRSEYTVDYMVFMPKTCNLSLLNKYGDAHIAELEGRADLSVQHGNIRLQTIEQQLSLDLKYGNCTVVEAANSDITMSHGNIRLKKANNINFITSYSKVQVDEAVDIKSHSINDNYKLGIVKEFRNMGKYDKVDIRQVENVIIVSKFSDFKIGVVKKSADLDMVYGSVIIKEVSKGFSNVLMAGERTDYQINVEAGSSYKMDATAQFANLKFPKVSKMVCQDNKGDERKVEFYVGKKLNPRSYIKAKVIYGEISVK